MNHEEARNDGLNRLLFFNRFPGGWVGVNSAHHSWRTEAWHSFAMALIRQPSVTGRIMVIYDVDPITKAEAAQAGFRPHS